MASRKPPKCGALKNSAETIPTLPSEAARRFASKSCRL